MSTMFKRSEQDVKELFNPYLMGNHWSRWVFLNKRSKRIAIKDHRTKENVFRILDLITLREDGVLQDHAIFDDPDWVRAEG